MLNLPKVDSQRDLEAQFALISAAFQPGEKETEENWEDRERALQRLRGLLAGRAYVDFDSPFHALLRPVLSEHVIGTVRFLLFFFSLALLVSCVYALQSFVYSDFSFPV